MKLTRASAYALRALAYLARHGEGGLVSAAAIAEAEGLPRRYLAKVLFALVRAGVRHSSAGPHGGFRLARPGHNGAGGGRAP